MRIYRKIIEAELLLMVKNRREREREGEREYKIREEKAFFTIHWLRKTFNNFPCTQLSLFVCVH